MKMCVLVPCVLKWRGLLFKKNEKGGRVGGGGGEK